MFSNTNRVHDESGTMTLSTLFGAVLGAIVLAGFMNFWLSANDSAVDRVDRSRQHVNLAQAANRISSDVKNASVPPSVVAPNDLRIERATETHRWLVQEDGTLVSQVAPNGTTDWASIPTQVWTTDVAHAAFALTTPSSRSMLIRINLGGGRNTGVETAVAVPAWAVRQSSSSAQIAAP